MQTANDDTPVNRPNARFAHVFVVLRADSYEREGGVIVTECTVTKVFSKQEMAEAEVVRMNALNAPKGCSYSWRIGRFVE
ncbi:MAG: hypothetical protein DCC68_07440 [Planctomycetota bacterium]|nr:MAG: hypothetical protein DCC68_07440 [Planctomycetota bacterium]